MATDVEITDPKLSIFVPVPSATEEGTCRVCHGAAGARGVGFWPTCWNCRDIPSGGVRIIVPISLVHTTESQLYAAARDYKSDYVTRDVRDRHALLLVAIAQRFLRAHRTCITNAAGVDWDTITVIPSTKGRVPHPLEEAIARAPALRPEHRQLMRWTGRQIERTRPNADAFEVTAEVSDLSVLLVDDTFTTGAKVQSAAVALTRRGANVVGAVPIGRVIDTSSDQHPEKLSFWQRQRDEPFTFAVCCLE